MLDELTNVNGAEGNAPATAAPALTEATIESAKTTEEVDAIFEKLVSERNVPDEVLEETTEETVEEEKAEPEVTEQAQTETPATAEAAPELRDDEKDLPPHIQQRLLAQRRAAAGWQKKAEAEAAEKAALKTAPAVPAAPVVTPEVAKPVASTDLFDPDADLPQEIMEKVEKAARAAADKAGGEIDEDGNYADPVKAANAYNAKFQLLVSQYGQAQILQKLNAEKQAAIDAENNRIFQSRMDKAMQTIAGMPEERREIVKQMLEENGGNNDYNIGVTAAIKDGLDWERALLRPFALLDATKNTKAEAKKEAALKASDASSIKPTTQTNGKAVPKDGLGIDFSKIDPENPRTYQKYFDADIKERTSKRTDAIMAFLMKQN